MIADSFKGSGEDRIVGIATHLKAAISTDIGVAGVHPLKKAAAGRGTDGAPGVVLREANSLGRHAIKVGRLDDFLSVAAEVAVAKVVGKNVDDIWLAGRHREQKSKCKDGDETFHGIFGRR